MSTLNEEILRLEQAKVKIDEILIARGVSIPTGATLDTYYELIDSIQGGTSSSEVTATRANVLSGTTTITSDSNDEIVEGTMVNHGAISQSLNCGGSYIIPAGYHNGSGKITANSLASQTDGTATAAQILKDQTAYVGGVKITGTMANNGAVAPSALGAGGSYTIPAGYHNGSGKVTVQSLATLTASGDATAAQILTGKKAYVDGSLITGTMANQGAKTSSLNCGGSYTIPAGYHNGSGKVTANSLSSQTSGTATAAQIISGQTAWVNGSKLTGTLAVQSVITFNAAPYSATQITFTWKNPAKGAFSGIIIVGKTGSTPTSISDGTRYYRGSGNNTSPSGTSTAIVSGFSQGTTYYFRCFAYAIKDNADWVGGSLTASTTTKKKGSQTFTSSGTFTVPSGVTSIDIFCVGGGGASGGSRETKSTSGGSSGAGGGKTATKKAYAVTPGQTFAVTIGAGGVGAKPTSSNHSTAAASGGTTSFGSVLSASGGGGSRFGYSSGYYTAGSGGSGGGAAGSNNASHNGGSDGGSGYGTQSGNVIVAGSGQGTTTRAFGESSNTLYSGGGGGGRYTSGTNAGGSGGGGAGGSYYTIAGTAGSANTGGGAGGNGLGENGTFTGANGGSGICIVRWGY